MFIFFQHPVLKVLMTIVVSLIGFGFCKAYRYYVKNQRDSLIQPPFDLSGGMMTNLFILQCSIDSNWLSFI